MIMKKIISLLAILFAFTTNAQTRTFNPNTGDVEMDNILKDVNTKANKDITVFKNDVATKFNIAKNEIDDLLKVLSPGDVYMAAQTAQITSKPIDEVSKTYQANKEKGWGQIAKELGIKPGSKEFHQMKAQMKGNRNPNDEGHGQGQGKSNGHSQGHGNGNGHGKGNSKGKKD
jgi:hypothetical protein